MADNPYSLSLQVTHADGSTTRWGPDEVEAKNIPGDLEFSTSMPGGFGDIQSPLLRRIDTDYPDQNLLDNVTALGTGNEVAFDGRMAQFPRTHGDQFSVTAGGEGWVAHLRDDETFSMIFADRGLDGWRSMSRTRQLVLIATRTLSEWSSTADVTTALPALVANLQGTTPHAESWYDAGPGNLISSIYYDATFSGNGGNYTAKINSEAGDDADTGGSSTGNIAATGTASGTLAITTAVRYALAQYALTSLAVSTGTTSLGALRYLTVFGNHALTKQGTAPNQGFYGGDILAYTLAAVCPKLTYTTGSGGSIEQGTFVIPHLVFREATTAEDVVRQVTDYQAMEWGVYEDREFFWRTPDPDRVCWQARLADGAEPGFDGPAAQTLLNGVFVTYQDQAGVTHTVGPPGSNAEVTDSSLADPSSTNPATLSGIRKWQKLDLGVPTSSAGAITVGSVWLADKLSPQRRGSVSLTGMVSHPTKGPRPSWCVRAGDWLQITDSNNSAQRRIVETRYHHSTRTVDCTLDNVSASVASLMARFAVVLTGRV